MQRHFDSIDFTFPLDGVMLTDAAGEKTEQGLKIQIWVDAPSGRTFYVNGVPMKETMHDTYSCELLLKDFKTTLALTDPENGYKQEIDVYYLKKGFNKYRFSLDDNIWCLQNLTVNKDRYESIFEDPYFSLLKSIHDKHGSKFHINVYWETPRLGGFCIKDMTDKFKGEFIANSDWMRMSFHANANMPDRPYSHATYEQVYKEASRINEQIVRFAGEETFSKTVCTVHWGDISVEGAKALRDLGYKALVASFMWNKPNGVDIRSYLGAREVNILNKYGFWYDRDTDIIHFRYNGGLQGYEPEQLPARYENKKTETPLYHFMDLCLHEQYFYPEYKRHIPNYYEKLDAAASWCDENGYEPIFMDELFEFNTHKY